MSANKTGDATTGPCRKSSPGISYPSMKTDNGTIIDRVAAPLEEWLNDRFAAEFGHSCPGRAPALKVTPATRPEFGDYQCNDALGLARQLHMPPRDISGRLLAGAQLPPMLDKAEVAGPGFINMTLADDWLARQVESITADPRLGIPDAGGGSTVIFDYSSPNIAKPMHIGHIRSTIIGNALDRLHRALGYKVISDNHLGDWGTQFGVLIMGYRHYLDRQALQEDPIGELERVYVRSYEQGKKDPEWMDQCRSELVKLQQGDKENLDLWRRFVKISMGAFNQIYRRLEVAFDLVRGESHYQPVLEDTMDWMERGKLTEISEGATIVRLDEEGLPLCIVRKRDGGFNYATTDIATLRQRVSEFKPRRIVYVTDERQQLHFRQCFAICRRLGLETELEHVWFGLMRLPEGTFSTRQGNVIKLESLLDEAERRALEIVRRTSPELGATRQGEVARAVGIGAVKYADLCQSPQTAIVFSWDKALSLEGNSAPYLQYAHARIRSVMDKYRERFPTGDFASQPLCLEKAAERTLALKLLQFAPAVGRAAHQYKPNLLADYLYDLAQAYSAFYQQVPFLKAAPGTRESRVRLCQGVAGVLRRGLDLLGIATPDRI